MSTAVKIPPQQIRASLHDRVDKLSDDELEQAERQLEAFELKRRLDDLCDEYGEDWQAGRATQEMMDDAIRSYRTKLPRTAPGHP
jgi:hypothetical protein